MAGGKVNALSYMRNVGRSLGYSLIDNITEMNPTVATLVSTTKEQTQNLYHSIKDFKSTARDFGNSGPLADAREVGKDTWNNLLSDLKSGNWYNKARIDKVSSDVMGEAFGIDFDDFGDLDDAFNFDDDDNFGEQASLQEDSVKKTAQVIDAVGQKTSAAIASASVHSADYIVKNNRATSKALFDLNSKGFSTVISGLTSINSNLGVIVEMGKPLTEHMQNSALFYAKTNEYQQQSLELLKQIATNTAPKAVDTRKPSNTVTLIDLINSDGTINMNNIKRAAKQGYENSMLGLFTSMLGMMGGVKGAGKMFAASPLQMLLNTATGSLFDIKGRRGRSARDAMGNFNDILAGFLPAMLGKFQAADIDRMKVPDFMKSLLKGVRGNLPSSGLTTKMNTANYHKGPIEWDGMSRKALMDVIPTQLSQILSALTGQEPMMFDYRTGRWVKLYQVNRMIRQRTKQYADQAGGEMFSEIRRSIKNSSSMSKRGKKEYDAQIQAFLNQLMLSDDADFMRFISDGEFNFEKYKDYIHPELLKDLRARARLLAKSNSKYTNSYARNMYSARAGYGREMRNLGGSGDITEIMYNGAFGDLNNKRGSVSLHNQSRMKANGTFGPGISNIMYTVDEYDHNMFYYAQEIHKDVNFIASNLDMLVAGARPIGGRDDGTINFKPRIVLKPRESSEVARRNIPKGVVKPRRNVQTGAVEEVLNGGTDPRYEGFTEDEIEYIKAKERGGSNFRFNQSMEDRIQSKNEMRRAGNDTRQRIAGRYESLKQNRYIGKHITNLEGLAGVSTDAVVNILDAASTQINNFMYGTGTDGTSFVDVVKESFSGIFGQMAKTIADLIPAPIKAMFNYFKKKITESETYKNFKSGVKNQFKGWGKGLFTGWGGRNRNQNNGPTPGEMTAEEWAEQAAFGGAEGSGLFNFYDRLNREYDSTYTGYAGGGSYDYDEPVIIPFTRSRARARRHRTSGGSSGAFRSDDDAAAGPKVSRRMYEEYKRNKAKGQTAAQAHANAKNSAGVAAERVINKAANKIAAWFSDGLAQILGNKKPEDEQKELQKNINSKMKEMFKDAGVNKEALGAGALIGGGLSLLTGAFVGPIAGAAIGASVAFVSKSETAQKLLFGDLDENGERQGGVFNKKWSKFLTENVPQMGKGAALGGAAGLLFGSPVVGAVLGSAAGYVASSDNAKKWLFGEELEDGSYKEGKIPKKLQDFIKAKAPWAVAGGAAGLLIGPFGPMGNLVAGSMLGLVSQTEGFKKWMFGDKDGKFGEGGFTKLIQDKLLNPIVDMFKNMTSAVTEKMKELTHNLGKTIRGFILKRLGARLKKSPKLQKLVNAGKGLAKGAFNVVTSPVRGLSNAMRKHNIRSGRSAYLNGELMDVEARNAYRRDNMLFGGDSVMEGFDRDVLADIAGDNTQLESLRDTLGKLYDPNRAFQEEYAKNRETSVNTFNTAMEGRGERTQKQIRKIYKKYLANGNYISDEQARIAREEINELAGKVDAETINKLLSEVDAQREISARQDQAKEDNGESARNAIFDKLDAKNPLKRYYDALRANGGTLSDTEISKMQNLIDIEINKNNKTPEEETRDISQESLDESEKQTGIFITIEKLLHGIAAKLEVDPNILAGADRGLESMQEGLDNTVENVRETASDIIDATAVQADKAADTAAKATIATGNAASSAAQATRRGARTVSKGAKRLAGKAGKAIFSGLGKGFSALFGGGASGADDELFGDTGDDNPDVDSTGEDDTVRDQYGNEVTNMGSTEGKKNAAAKAGFLGSIATIPTIGAGVSTIVSKIDEIAANMYDNIGNGEKKKGLLDSLKDMLTGENGVLGGLVNFFTGGKLPGILGTFGTFKTALSQFIGPAIGTAVVAGALSGKLDPLWSKLGLAGKSNSEKGVDSNSSWTGMTAKDANGNEQAVAMDENGKPVQDENGNYVSTSGETLNSSTVKYTESGATDSLGQRTRKSAARAIVTGAISKATGNGFIKGANGAFAATAKSLGKSWSKAATKAGAIIEKSPAASKIVSKIGDLIGKVFDKLSGCIAKVTGNVSESTAATALSKFKQKLITSIQEKAEKSGSELLKKATADLAKTAAIVLKVALILWDFEEGFNNASANWGVSEPSLGQKIGSGIVHALLNLIPVVGLFIPESLLFDIYGNFILPIFDKEGAANLKGQKADAEEELRKYNEENGTNYTWSEYTKQVKGNYTWGERIANGAKSVGTSIWNTAKKGANSVANFFGGNKEEAATAGGASGIINKAADMWKRYTPMGMAYNFATNPEARSNMIDTAKNIGGKAIDAWGKYTPTGIAFNKLKETGSRVTEGFGKVLGAIKGKISGFAGDISNLGPQEVLNLQMNDIKSILQDIKDATIASSVASGAAEYVDNVSSDMRKKLTSMTSKLNSKLETEIASAEGSSDTGSKRGGGILSKIYNIGKGFLNTITGNGGGDSGMVSQRDPRYAGMSIGGRSVGDMGCGPASAVNALNALGKSSSMSSAVSNANRYQTTGGTDISYFADEFRRNGAGADYVSGASMYDSVASGRPTVLMGQDRSNTSKDFSPFGPKNHYVVANGINRDGSVNISDPETRGVRRYSPNILRSVKIGVAATGSGIGRRVNRLAQKNRRFLNRYSAGASAIDTTITQNATNAPAEWTQDNIKIANLGIWSPISAEEINAFVQKKRPDSPFVGQGDVFVQAGEESGLDPRYILAHAAVESGWGTSNYAVNHHNYFGIGAFDTNPDNAKNYGNPGLATGIIEGAKWISRNYYHGKYGQTCIYKMRYNNNVHQYCTSTTWVDSIANIIYQMPENTKLTLTDTAVGNAPSGSSISHGGTSGSFGTTESSTTAGGEEKLTIGNALSKIMSVFTNAFTGALFGNNSSSSSTGTTGSTSSGSNGSAVVSSGSAAQGDIANNFPYFNQGEEPWGSKQYSSTGNASQTIKSSGCGPTSMAMVMKSYGINTDPSITAQYSLDHGYRTANSGTAWGYFGDIGQSAGLEVNNFSGVDTAKQYLDNNIPVIGSMRPGDFTKGGHYIVFSGKDGENVTVNDPASRDRTGKVWDANSALSQAKNFWAVSKGGKGSIGTYGTTSQESTTSKTTASSVLPTAGVSTVLNGGGSSGLMNYRGSRAGLRLLRDNGFAGGESGQIPSFNGNRQVGIGQFSQSMFNNLPNVGGGLDPQMQAQVNKAAMSKDTAAMLKVIIELVSNVASNTSSISEILEVVKQLCSASGNAELKESAAGIRNVPSSYVSRPGTGQNTLDALNDLRSLVDQVLAS